MSEYWKSTPSYWCKHCSTYVRDTSLERRNHEASAKHQNNIQRSLRELHNRNDREVREKERAKKEVERLNALVGGKPAAAGREKGILGVKDVGGGSKAGGGGPTLTAAQQRKAHAEQLAAMGVQLPPELQKEITGVGGWEVVSERVVEGDGDVGAGRSMADIMKAEREVKVEGGEEVESKGVHKRKAGDEEEEEMERSRKKAWGSRFKTYPGDEDAKDDGADLDSLLSGVKKTTKQETPDVKKEEGREEADGKPETTDIERSSAREPHDNDGTASTALKDEETSLKREDSAEGIDSAPPVVFFKKRKTKK